MKGLIILLNIVLCSTIFCYSQEDSLELNKKQSFQLSLNGYLSDMRSVMFSEPDDPWLSDNLLHNRLNIMAHCGNKVTASIQLRNRFMFGESLRLIPGYSEELEKGAGLMNLSRNIIDKPSYLLNTSIDRMFFQFNNENFYLTAGRQRINWGQTFVWNPNDVFNVQNYFDFDYIEKPGSDAIRMQYYMGYTSCLEVAAKVDRDKKLTGGIYYRFNSFSYDFQLLGGILKEEDIFLGFGWAGDISGAGFRGETSYFRPLHKFSQSAGKWISSLSLDYTFANSLYLQFEGLYNMKTTDGEVNSFYDYYQGTLDVKQLSFSEWNYYISSAYPLTPLARLSISGIFFPEVKGFYLGTSFDYSLKDNSELSIIAQTFRGDFDTVGTGLQNSDDSLFFGFIRYKYSF